jgi:methylmalonyl-CoA mutase cobalamin-binding subunit
MSDVHPAREEVIDAAMAGLGGTVLRRSVFDVQDEIAAAKHAERKAKLEKLRGEKAPSAGA